jgi:two-component system sensor histidine kinase SenX3
MEKPTPGLDIATFLGASIHDMKNSVSVMQALLENSLTEVLIHAPHAVSQLDQALYETRRVSDNLVQLLALYKIAGDLYPFDPQEHEVGEFLAEAAARVSSLAQFRGIALEHVCEPDLYWYFDHELVLVAIVQALHNGLRYTRAAVRLSAGCRDGKLEFRVEDDGPGYPAGMLQGDFPASQNIRFATGSTGLGLYFSAAVAQLHRDRKHTGSTRLENGSALGGGAFILTLP